MELVGLTKPLKILVIDPSGLLWGSERALLDLLANVDASRYQTTVVTPLGSQLGDRVAALGIRVIEGPIGMLHRKGITARLHAVAWLATIIRRLRPDVIHVNEAGAALIVAAARFGRATPMVVHVRLTDDARRLAKGLPRFANPRFIVAISHFIARELGSDETSNAGSPVSPNVRVIYDAFDSAGFEAEASTGIRGLKKKPVTVLMVGRICREKGQHLLLDAAERLAEEEILFLFAGGVPPDSPTESAYHAMVLERANTPALRDRVKFLGDRPDVAALMNTCDLVVLASANEPFGRVLLEALSLGIPVVASDRGGPPEILGNSDRGILFKTGDADSLAAAILKSLSDPESASAAAMRGRAWVRENCAPLVHTENIQGLWDAATGGSR